MVDEGEALPEEAVDGKKNEDAETKNQENAAPAQMASVADLFSFAESNQSKLLIAGGFLLAMLSGAVFPGKIPTKLSTRTTQLTTSTFQPWPFTFQQRLRILRKHQVVSRPFVS